MTYTKIEQSNVNIAHVHAERLQQALTLIQHLLPFTPTKISELTPQDISNTDFFAHRFCKLQDHIGTKILSLVLHKKAVNLDGMTPIDVFNLAEKYHIIESKTEWNTMHEIRNHLTHEYPDEPHITAEHFNKAVKATQRLLEIWENLKNHLEEKK